MANQTGRPVAPARKLVAAVMGTIAVFVMALGLGMSSWGVVIFGLALLALSIALGMVNVVRRGARAWVAGTAEVRAISPPPTSSAVYGRAEIQAVVVAPGLPTSEVTIREPRVPVVKWPFPGDTLPITVDVDDMRRVRINWDEATPHERGEDPPPPPTEYEEIPDDDLLGDVEPPPWAARDRGWSPPPDEPPPPPPPGATYEEIPVVVRDTPGGPVVEGELVDADAQPQPLPRRAAAGSYAAPPADEFAATEEEAPEEPGPSEWSRPGGAAPATATAATFAGAAGAARAAASAPGPARPAGTRPSPRPRGGTATATADPQAMVDPETMADQAAAAPPPTQRPPHHDDALPVDVPLDEPVPDTGETTTRAEPIRRPEPTATSTTATPSPMTSFPTAPEPVSPPRAAPQPTTPRPPAPEPHDDIDLPLDGDPDPAPESTPQAASAVADDLIAPPAAPRESTRFMSNAAHDAETAAAGPRPTGVIAGMAAAFTAAAAAVKDKVTRPTHAEQRPHAEPTDPDPAPAADHPTPPPTAASNTAAAGAGPWSAPPKTPEPDEHADDLITAYPSARPGPAGAIYGVGITVLVTELSRSIAFYRDTLGFYELDSGDGSAVLASGDTRLVLRTVGELGNEAGRLIYLNLEVGDIEAVYGELQAKGVPFVHGPRPVNRGDRLELWSATFRDPDDHNIAITQWRAIRQP
ncbi:VOC family protein [Paractinoplanes rishiriensis]|uniref:VOC domain-containing protein n=1 Tax=Paractinoplanes rishiriensis TaxID=1050105 RepID=A0A919MYI9_9ACTN|nr:VOC family protein [Actinoplanes rishiriensis]GIF00254.1 hypothetical protein Ari01nite_77180 [Actinoplanes rishiriensis]